MEKIPGVSIKIYLINMYHKHKAQGIISILYWAPLKCSNLCINTQFIISRIMLFVRKFINLFVYKWKWYVNKLVRLPSSNLSIFKTAGYWIVLFISYEKFPNIRLWYLFSFVSQFNSIQYTPTSYVFMYGDDKERSMRFLTKKNPRNSVKFFL